jgi:hypothetical protein
MLIPGASDAKNKAETTVAEELVEMAAPDPPTRATQALERLGRTVALGPPPLIAGEDGAAYDLRHGSVTAAVKSKDFLEEIWVRDIVDLSWNVLRLRRLKAQLLTYCTAAQVRGYLKELCGTSQAAAFPVCR